MLNGMLDGKEMLSTSRRQRMAREWLWALGSVLAVATLYVTVVSNMQNGSRGGLLSVSAHAWAVLWAECLAGHFWIATGILYGVVQLARLTLWAVRTARQEMRRAESERSGRSS